MCVCDWKHPTWWVRFACLARGPSHWFGSRHGRIWSCSYLELRVLKLSINVLEPWNQSLDKEGSSLYDLYVLHHAPSVIQTWSSYPNFLFPPEPWLPSGLAVGPSASTAPDLAIWNRWVTNGHQPHHSLRTATGSSKVSSSPSAASAGAAGSPVSGGSWKWLAEDGAS